MIIMMARVDRGITPNVHETIKFERRRRHQMHSEQDGFTLTWGEQESVCPWITEREGSH